MQLPEGVLVRAKNAVHAFQGLAVFVAWALTVAVFTEEGRTDGRTGFYFVLCFLTIPALIYQTAISTFPRTRRFANPYAFAAVDASFLILWLSAAIAVSVWVNDGIAVGHKKENSEEEGCETFGYGSTKKCDLSQVQVGLGVMIFFLFLATAGLSLYTAIYFHRHGTIPNTHRSDISNPIPVNHQTHSPDFDPNPHDAFDHDDFDDEESMHHFQPHPSGPLNQPHTDDENVAHLTPTQLGHRIPRRPLSWERSPMESYDTTYSGAESAERGRGRENRADPFADSYAGAGGDPFRDDVGLSHEHGGYAGGGGGRGTVEFPEADYHR